MFSQWPFLCSVIKRVLALLLILYLRHPEKLLCSVNCRSLAEHNAARAQKNKDKVDIRKYGI